MSVPIPSDYQTFKICSLSNSFVYAPFPNFSLDEGGIDEWLEWRDFGDVNDLKGSGLFLVNGFDTNDDLDRTIKMTIDCAAVLQFSVSDRSKITPRSSCACASFDMDSAVNSAFLTHGTRWISELRVELGKKNFGDMRRMEEMEKQRKFDEMSAEITKLRTSSQNPPNPLPVQQYISPTPQQYVPLSGQQYPFPPQQYASHIHDDPQRQTPPSKRKMKQESADDSDAEPSVSMSALKKFFKKQH